MNNTPNTERDPQIAKALKTLPEAPEHGSDFWAQLDGSFEAESPGGSNGAEVHLPGHESKSRLQFRVLAAAAAVIVVGLVGLSVLNNRDSEIIFAQPGTPTTPADTTAPTATTDPIVSTTSAPAAGANVPVFPERAESELFLYDVPVPPGFEVRFATGRGVSQSLVTDQFDGFIEVYNYDRLDPNWVDEVVTFGSGELIEQKTVRVPLYERRSGGLFDEGVFLDVEQFTYELEDSVRVERSYNFSDRVISAAVTLKNSVTVDYLPETILDDFRMYNAAFVPIDLAGCSAFGDPAPETPATLNTAQAARFEGIVQALVACDWEALEAQLDPSGFTASFGGNDALDLWKSSEAYGEPILETLLDHLGAEPGFSDNGEAAFPRPHLLFWEDVTDDMEQELLELGYTQEDLDFYAEMGGYWGYRTGIDAEGNWQYFVVGD